MNKLDTIDRRILETIEKLSIIPEVSSHRRVAPEAVRGRLDLNDGEYRTRVEDLERKGLLELSSGMAAVLTAEGRRMLL